MKNRVCLKKNIVTRWNEAGLLHVLAADLFERLPDHSKAVKRVYRPSSVFARAADSGYRSQRCNKSRALQLPPFISI